MHDARAVRSRQRVADLHGDRQRLVDLQRPAAGQPGFERLAVEQLHHEVRRRRRAAPTS